MLTVLLVLALLAFITVTVSVLLICTEAGRPYSVDVALIRAFTTAAAILTLALCVVAVATVVIYQ